MTADGGFHLPGPLRDRLERLAAGCGLTPSQLLELRVGQAVDPNYDVQPLPQVIGARVKGPGRIPLRVDVDGRTAARLVAHAATADVPVAHVAALTLAAAPDGAMGEAADRAATLHRSRERRRAEQVAIAAAEAKRRSLRPSTGRGITQPPVGSSDTGPTETQRPSTAHFGASAVRVVEKGPTE